MNNKKQINKITSRKEKQHVPGGDGFNQKITAKMWREACENGAKAKELLINMRMPNGAKFTKAFLENGSEIEISEVSELQAKQWANELCPSWAYKGFRQ